MRCVEGRNKKKFHVAVVVAWALFRGGKRREGKIYSNFLFQHFFPSPASFGFLLLLPLLVDGEESERELKYFFCFFSFSSFFIPNPHCWLKKKHPCFLLTTTQFHFSLSLSHSLRHFFTFNVIVVVVVCDWSEEEKEVEEGEY
jgi:hypothetical protein